MISQQKKRKMSETKITYIDLEFDLEYLTYGPLQIDIHWETKNELSKGLEKCEKYFNKLYRSFWKDYLQDIKTRANEAYKLIPEDKEFITSETYNKIIEIVPEFDFTLTKKVDTQVLSDIFNTIYGPEDEIYDIWMYPNDPKLILYNADGQKQETYDLPLKNVLNFITKSQNNYWKIKIKFEELSRHFKYPNGEIIQDDIPLNYLYNLIFQYGNVKFWHSVKTFSLGKKKYPFKNVYLPPRIVFINQVFPLETTRDQEMLQLTLKKLSGEKNIKFPRDIRHMLHQFAKGNEKMKMK
jgi:hypothetical protein